MNSDATGTYVQKTDYDDLRRDNYAQKTKIQHFETAIKEAVMAMVREEQSLAVIKANAIIEMVDRVSVTGASIMCISEIDDYIENLKGGSE